MAGLKYVFLPCLLLSSFVLPAQNFNRPVPSGFPPYEFVLHDSSYQGYYLTAPFGLNGNPGMPIPLLILDSKGYILAHYVPVGALNVLDFKFNPEAQLYQFIKFKNPQNVQYFLMDSGLNLVDSFSTVNGILPDIHEFLISKNNSYLLRNADEIK